MTAKDDKSARALRAISQKLENGETAIIVDEKLKARGTDPNSEVLPWQQFDRDLKQNFIVPELQQARRDTIDDFYREIGVRIPDDKRERMITDEVNAGEAQTFIRRDVWYKSLTESLLRFNAFMDTDITVKANEPVRGEADYYAD